MCIAAYFHEALRHRDGVEVITIGPTSGPKIPWGPEFFYPKYAYYPVIETPFASNLEMLHFLEGPYADIVLQVDAGFFMLQPPSIPCAIIATDPHCLYYGRQRQIADFFFNMQPSYAQPGDHILPYAYCAYTHYPEPDIKPEYDVIINGLRYPSRVAMEHMLLDEGISVYAKLGDIWDEYRIATCKARVVFTCSSRDDLIARVFETLAMHKPLVTNRVSALEDFFTPGEQLMAFDSLDEGKEQIKWLLAHPKEAEEMAQAGYEAVQGHTYDARVQEILEVTGFA